MHLQTICNLIYYIASVNFCDLSGPSGLKGSIMHRHQRRIRCALVLAGAIGAVQAAPISMAGQTGSDSSHTLQEVVVTAQRFHSTVFATPMSITALTGNDLQQHGITSMQDVVRSVPGLSVRTASPALTEFEARGLSSSGGSSPTVGFYLDDVPLSPPAGSQSGKIVIDPSLYDLQRIEVLRGPQGTLYGAGSMGGTVRLITAPPKLRTWAGSVQVDGSYTDGGGPNGTLDFMLNLPMGTRSALRLVGTDQHRSGWINRVVLNPFPLPANPAAPPRGNVLAMQPSQTFSNVNTEDLRNGRLEWLLRPSDALSITALVMYEQLKMGGYDLIDSPPGLNAHYEAAPTREPLRDESHLYALTVHWRTSGGNLTSVSSWLTRQTMQTQDAAESFWATLDTLYGAAPPLSAPAGQPSMASLPYSESDPMHQFSQELRFTTTGTGSLRGTVGAFYSNMTSEWNEYGANPVFSDPNSSWGVAGEYNPNGIVFASIDPYHLEQWALYADGSWRIDHDWTLSAGLRYFHYSSEADESAWGFFSTIPLGTSPPPPLVTAASDHGVTPRVNLAYRVNDELNWYATISKGYRPGGANQSVPSNLCGTTPTSYKPDTVWNYEIGGKARSSDRRLTFNADFFYMKWNGVQLYVPLPCGYSYNTNAGDGRTFGPEVELHALLGAGWSLAIGGTWVDAKINHVTASAFYGSGATVFGPNGMAVCASQAGCELPILNVPHSTASVDLSWAHSLAHDRTITARVADEYTGRASDASYYFGIPLPAYNLVNARASLRSGPWTASFYADNLTNKEAFLTANNTAFQVNISQLVRYAVNQPRTIGLELSMDF